MAANYRIFSFSVKRWNFRFQVGWLEFCAFRLLIMSRDVYDSYVTALEIACLWFCVSAGYEDWQGEDLR